MSDEEIMAEKFQNDVRDLIAMYCDKVPPFRLACYLSAMGTSLAYEAGGGI